MKEATHRIGEAVAFHRGDGVHPGVVLAHGRDGCRVVDAHTGRTYTVLYEGLLRHITVPGDALRPAVTALHAMGIPVHLSDEQRRALED